MAKSKNDNINISIFTALKVSEISRVPVLIMSNPGLGKSTSVEMFAEVRDYHLVLLRGNSTTAEEVMGYDVATSDQENPTTRHLRPSWYTEILKVAEKGGKSLLFLDEITTANEYVQASLLHLVFERKVGSERLPENTLIVSAGNYAQNLSNSMQMLPPLMNRFMIYNITPDHTDLDTFLCKYDGAIASSEGKVKDFMGSLRDTMKKLDAQEVEIPADQYNKIGEYIERGIKQTARALMTSGGKPVDLAITELNGIYADAENETKLYGFTTFRTLNYLRDVTSLSGEACVEVHLATQTNLCYNSNIKITLEGCRWLFLVLFWKGDALWRSRRPFTAVRNADLKAPNGMAGVLPAVPGIPWKRTCRFRRRRWGMLAGNQ